MYLKNKIFSASLIIILGTQIVKAQTTTVRGFVYEKETGEPAIFVNVYLKGTTLGVNTDINGYYSIVKVPRGNYTLTATGIGFDTTTQEVIVADEEIITRKLYLPKKAVTLQSVEISAEREAQKTEVKMSVATLTPKDIKQIPTIGADPDLVQYLQVLPGVVFSGDQGGQLYIRGGTPIQNKVLLDGMTIYNPFHSIGLFSVFDTDIMKNADIYTGGFGGQFGGRISSVMDITTRDGNKKRFAGKVSTGTFQSKVLFEGPLAKQKEEGGGSASFIVSLKNSYLDQSSKVLYKHVDENGLPYSFNDLYAKINLNGANGSKINFFGFNFTDKVNYTNQAKLNWESTGLGSSFILVPGSSATLLDGTFAYSKYKITQTEGDEKPRTSLVNGFNMGLGWTYFIGKNDINYGFEISGFKTDYTFYNYVNTKISAVENTTELGIFFKYKFVIKKLVVDPSMRFQYYASLNQFSPEPRLGLKYNISDKIRLKAASGLYAQNLLAAVSDRDVVNLFYGFLSDPDNLQQEFKNKGVDSRLQHAKHILAGVEYDVTKRITLNAEVYMKDFNQLINLNRDKIYPDDGTHRDEPDSIKKDFIIERGLAQGADFTLKYDYRRLYVWLVYSLGFSTRDNGNYEYYPHFDRRHNVNVVVTYKFGKKNDWEADVRWNYGSGFPFTQTQGYYPYLNFQSGGLQTNYTTANGQMGIIYGDYNKKRLPDYHRLDFSVKKNFYVGKNSEIQVVASLVNAYDRENIFYFDRVRYRRINQLPILPSIGANMTF
jgi:hypothetical protein